MHNAIAYNPLIDVQPVSEQQPPTPGQPLQFLFSITSYGMDYPSGQLGPAVVVMNTLTFLCTPSILIGRAAWEAESHCLCVSTVLE